MNRTALVAVMVAGIVLGAGQALAQRGERGGRGGRGGPPLRPGQTYNVTDYGAVGDGTTLNTAAIQRALNLCSTAGGGEVLIPAGNFLTGSILIGPRTTLKLEKDAILTGSPNKEDYPLMNVRWEGERRPGHRALIAFNNVDHVGVVGEGRIVGPPRELANLRPNRAGEARGPSILEPIECRNLLLEGITIEYQRMWTVHLTYCQDVVVRNVTIRSSQTNGDGIDVDSCKNVLIEGCDIEAGDDAIALKSGRGMEAVRIARPTENVTIRDCTLSCPSFACVGIGTEMSGGVRNVTIENCRFVRAVNAIFIKSRDGRGGFIENITGSNWEVGPDVQHLVHFDVRNKGIVATETVEGLEGIPRVRNLSFDNIRTQAQRLLWVTSIAPEKPAENISLTNVTGTAQRAIDVANIRNLVLKNINISGFEGPFLTSENVTGPNIENIKEPKDTM